MTGTVAVRRIVATPGRPAAAAWGVIADLIAPRSGASRDEVDTAAGVGISMVAAEAMRDSAIVLHGVGPRLRIYCLYDEDAMLSEGASEEALAWCPTDGDWQMSIPCPPEDLPWVQEALARHTVRITARNWEERGPSEPKAERGERGEDGSATINREGFLRP